MFRFWFLIAVVVFMAAGCGRSQPLISGGKTPDDWINVLHDESVGARVEAVRKLGNIGDRHPNALPAVFDVLTDDSPAVRKEVIFAIVRTWPASRDALPLLEQVKENDDDSAIRKLAAEAYLNLTARK